MPQPPHFVTLPPPPPESPRAAVPAGAGRIAKPRATLNVDLGPLREAVEARSAAAGVKASAWVRQALQEALARPQGAAVTDHEPGVATPPAAAGPQGVDASRGPGVYRAWFDAEQTAKLDQVVARTGRRSRIKALHALLDGVQLEPAGASAVDLVSAVGALTRSNHELVAIGRNLNQLTKNLNAYPGKTTAADRSAIERVLAMTRGHVEQAARLVAELRPLVKPVRSGRREG